MRVWVGGERDSDFLYCLTRADGQVHRVPHTCTLHNSIATVRDEIYNGTKVTKNTIGLFLLGKSLLRLGTEDPAGFF